MYPYPFCSTAQGSNRDKHVVHDGYKEDGKAKETINDQTFLCIGRFRIPIPKWNYTEFYFPVVELCRSILLDHSLYISVHFIHIIRIAQSQKGPKYVVSFPSRSIQITTVFVYGSYKVVLKYCIIGHTFINTPDDVIGLFSGRQMFTDRILITKGFICKTVGYENTPFHN